MDDGGPTAGKPGIMKRGFSKIAGLIGRQTDGDVTEKEIISMVNEGHEQGVLQASEAEMITNIFEFGDKEAQDIMVHRKNIVALDGNMTLQEALTFIIHENKSRYPVYEGDIDHIIGILHFKDAVRTRETSKSSTITEKKIKSIKGLVREVKFIPETRNIDALFHNIGREIAVAVKEGGPDVNNNFRLAAVVAKAKANNMPNETIERGIKKAAGDAGNVNYEYVTYEGYGPGGIAVIVDALTDNKNRTAANVRSAFTKGRGSIGTQGCVSFMFDKKGQIIIDKEEYDGDGDDLMMTALDAGAEDFSEEADSFEVITDPDALEAVRAALEEAGVTMVSSEVTMIPQNYVALTDETDIKNLQRTLDLLDEDDDVQAVYTNWDE